MNDVLNALFSLVQERKDLTPITNNHFRSRPTHFKPGSLLQIGPNGADETDAFFDDDCFLHCIAFPPDINVPIYILQYVLWLQEGKWNSINNQTFIWSLGAAPNGLPLLASVMNNMLKFQVGTKDICNTAVAEHGGRILSLVEQAPPSEIEIGRDGNIWTILSKTSLNGQIPTNDILSAGTFSAHCKTCPKTSDHIHVSYSSI